MKTSQKTSTDIKSADFRLISEKITEGFPIKATGLKRPFVKGKFLYSGSKKILIQGVTYGTFKPNGDGEPFPDIATVRKDFSMMVIHHINTIRVYTPPPLWLLDLAGAFGIRVMLGLPWEQHITFLDDPQRVQKIRDQIRQQVRKYVGHPTVLCYAVGNEIPASIVRWYGPRKIEKFLKELYEIVKAEDPGGLVTYVNFPPTEYLQIDFFDLFCFNVYLETSESLENYLARLQILSKDKPLIMAEIGLDSQRNGEDRQAEVLDWQIQTTLKKGAAGLFIFSWTDEWYRGGFEILDWDFGLTGRDRQPKKALDTVKGAFGAELISYDNDWPCISVAVCTLNGADTLKECLDSLFNQNYPDFEVIVVSDGSTDATESIARAYPCKLIATPNYGLSSARNTAWKTAQGAIVVYIDDDAYAAPDWLLHLAISFRERDFVAVGGPNIPPEGDGMVADCVANAPGGPIHVLLSDEEAEHIPGCNMAFRKDILEETGGFDPLFRAAGDDVDLCWKILDRKKKIGFCPTAVVWHHRRNSVRAYWKQQKGYGKAEGLLAGKWPEKFNFAGHLNWSGRLYSPGTIHPLLYPRTKVEYGTWGTGFFQSLYERDPNQLLFLPLLPEWYLLIAGLIGFSALGFLWPPLFWLIPLWMIALLIIVIQAVRSVLITYKTSMPFSLKKSCIQRYIITVGLFLIQPLARLTGRIEYGLTLWRRKHKVAMAWPVQRIDKVWSENWKSTEDWLTQLESLFHQNRVQTRRGGIYDSWDLEIREGLSTPTRILMAIEEHGSGQQQLLFRIWPIFSKANLIPFLFLSTLTIAAFISNAWLASGILLVFTLIWGYFVFQYNLPLTRKCLGQLTPPPSPSNLASANGKEK